MEDSQIEVLIGKKLLFLVERAAENKDKESSYGKDLARLKEL